LERLIEDENHGRLPEVQLPTPSYHAFLKIVRSYDQYALSAKRYGKRAAKLAFGRTDIGLQMSFPLERVEVDHQKIDLMALTEHLGFPDCRPILTAAIDHYSRACTGYTLSFSTGVGTVLACLKRSILLEPQHYDEDGVLLTEESWDCCGVPLAFGFDNGPEFHSTAVTHALYQVGAGVEYTRAYTPQHKGIVERFFGTVSVQFCRGLPGFTFSDTKERGDYPAHTKAALTLEQIDRHFLRWLVDVYHRTPHSATGEPPIERFRRGMRERPARMVNLSEMVPFQGRTEDRAITNQGVRINNRFYQAPELTEIAVSNEFKAAGNKVTVYASDYDKERIWIHNPVNGKPLEINWTQQAAPELTVQEKAHAKESRKKAHLSLGDIRADIRKEAAQNKQQSKRGKVLSDQVVEKSEALAQTPSVLQQEGDLAKTEEKLGQIDTDYSSADWSW